MPQTDGGRPPRVTASYDAHTPEEMAHLVESVGVRKATLAWDKLLTLGILAGAFIAFGGLLYTVAVTGSGLGYGPTRLIGGVAFSLGLILVIVGGAELFTGNALIVMAHASRKVTTRALLRNWMIVYTGNLIGSVATAVMVVAAGTLETADGAVGETAAAIAAAKLELAPVPAFVRGVLCNVLVCLAVWLCFAARSATDRILCIVPPITAFVAIGLEHSVANMYLIPVAMVGGLVPADLAGLGQNLAVVTLGNIVGGGVLVAGVYWLVYLRRG